jgi:hypothetical protein
MTRGNSLLERLGGCSFMGLLGLVWVGCGLYLLARDQHDQKQKYRPALTRHLISA